MSEDDVRDLVYRRIAGGTQRAFADELGVNHVCLNNFLKFRRSAPFAKLLKGLGLRRVVTYEPCSPSARCLPLKDES